MNKFIRKLKRSSRVIRYIYYFICIVYIVSLFFFIKSLLNLTGLETVLRIVFIIFYLIGLAIHRVEVLSFDELVRCLLGISDYINREWWYVKQYIIFLAFFPVLELIIYCLKGKKYRQILIACILNFSILLK